MCLIDPQVGDKVVGSVVVWHCSAQLHIDIVEEPFTLSAALPLGSTAIVMTIHWSAMAHYLHGPQLRFVKKACIHTTIGQIRHACDAATRQLGEGYALEPEGISEGGVIFTCWPGKNDSTSYKSVRFHGLQVVLYTRPQMTMCSLKWTPHLSGCSSS